ncbi:MAG: fibronectin type III domain-containing protein, partial [Actinomycetes bacterium]
MNRIATSVVALGLTAALGVGVCTGFASSARAAGDAGIVIATTTPDDSLIVAQSPIATAVASLPRGIVVTNHGGKPVTLSSQGKATISKPRPGNAPATFAGLEAGRSYTVSVGGKVIGAVLAVSEPAAASSLVVRATASPTTVDMSWKATPTAQTGPLTYDITASAEGKPVVKSTVKDVLTARLAGLDPRALYTFSVVARNTAGAATAVFATMTRTLADITGRDGDIAVTTVKAIEPAPAPASPAAPPAPAAPTTRTIYVCPDGFVDAGTNCTK